MIDRLGRTIDYLRISITDRCNFRCTYCMPEDVPDIGHDAVLRYEEILRICRNAVAVGITKFKITGGEPLVRLGAVDFMAALKAMPGVDAVTVTTNGFALAGVLPRLVDIGIDGINISLDTVRRELFHRITRVDGLATVLGAIEEAAASPISTKINAVLLQETRKDIIPLATIAARLPVDVRFIEVMPIGLGSGTKGLTEDDVLALLRQKWPDLEQTREVRGNGPAVYYKSNSLNGRIGFIAATTHRFCETCNRMRLTSTGFLKPCLCYERGIDLRQILRHVPEVRQDEALQRAFLQGANEKPARHCFDEMQDITEQHTMNCIGG